MISGDTNSGEPYLLYCGSEGVIFWAKPKSQILMSSRAGCTIRMLGGCRAELGGLLRATLPERGNSYSLGLGEH